MTMIPAEAANTERCVWAGNGVVRAILGLPLTFLPRCAVFPACRRDPPATALVTAATCAAATRHDDGPDAPRGLATPTVTTAMSPFSRPDEQES